MAATVGCAAKVVSWRKAEAREVDSALQAVLVFEGSWSMAGFKKAGGWGQKPRNQAGEAKKPESQEASKSKSLEVAKPRSRRSQEAGKPRSQAQKKLQKQHNKSIPNNSISPLQALASNQLARFHS